MRLVRAGAIHTAIVTTTPARPPSSIALRLQCWWQALRQRHRDRLTCSILESLDDRMLRDIGIERSEIASIVATSGRPCRHRRHSAN